MLVAKEACRSAQMDFLRSRELDLFGDDAGRTKNDPMVSLLTVNCTDADAARFDNSTEPHHHLMRNFSKIIPISIEGIFKDDKLVLVRGVPGSGKTTLCRNILRDWWRGNLWKDRYDFIFYVDVPLLLSLFDGSLSSEANVLEDLYPGVFQSISYDEAKFFNCLIIIDSIDECDLHKVCAHKKTSSVEDAIKRAIISPENHSIIILGRPHGCDEVRQRLLKDVTFQFVEVIGFSTEHLIYYVDKFFEGAVVDCAKVWRKLRENTSLFAMMHLPVFANIVCNIFAEYSTLAIETMTEIYVYVYAVLLTRHLKGPWAKAVDCSTFRSLFNGVIVLDALAKISMLAFESLTSGRTVLQLNDYAFSDVELSLASSFLIRRQKYLVFSHLTWMEFLPALYLVMKRVNLDEELISNNRMIGVLPMYFGLLGGAVENSDSPGIIRDFVRPLMRTSPSRSIVKHPLAYVFGHLLYHKDTYHHLYLNLIFEFRNSSLLSDTDLFWDNSADLSVRNHHELDHVLYFMKNVMTSSCKEENCLQRRIGWLTIEPSYGEISLIEVAKLYECILVTAGNVNRLQLWFFSVDEEKMDFVARTCCLVRGVWLHTIRPSSSDCWEILVRRLSEAKRNGNLSLEVLMIDRCSVPQATEDLIKGIVRDVFIR